MRKHIIVLTVAVASILTATEAANADPLYAVVAEPCVPPDKMHGQFSACLVARNKTEQAHCVCKCVSIVSKDTCKWQVHVKGDGYDR
jgi:hypothetical protein